MFSDILLTVDFDRTMTAPDSTVPKVNIEAMTTYEKEDGDIEGPFSVGLHISKELDSGTTELYVFSGESIFTDSTSEMVYGNNAALFADIAASFMEEETISVIPEKSYAVSNLTITQAKVIYCGLAVAIVVPIALITTGIVIWAKRRRK